MFPAIFLEEYVLYLFAYGNVEDVEVDCLWWYPYLYLQPVSSKYLLNKTMQQKSIYIDIPNLE